MTADRRVRIPRESGERAALHYFVVVPLAQLLRGDPRSEHCRKHRAGRGADEDIR